MKKKRRIRVIVTRRRTLRIQLPVIRVRCPVCEREVVALTTSEAAAALEVDALALGELLAAGTVHAIRMVSGSLRVCRDSL
ncbi:MAG: hypothetical protein ACREAM_18375 [Blastocatellia bacterium]